MTELWPHQERVIGIAENRSGYMIAHDMGVGKTCSALMLMKRLGMRRTLIVCPKAVVPVWPLQAERHGSHYANVIALYKGGVKNRAAKAAFEVDPESSLCCCNKLRSGFGVQRL